MQGYWPDGIYTAPTDAALKYDIEASKQMGFNMLRKHIKVEPDRHVMTSTYNVGWGGLGWGDQWTLLCICRCCLELPPDLPVACVV